MYGWGGGPRSLSYNNDANNVFSYKKILFVYKYILHCVPYIYQVP